VTFSRSLAEHIISNHFPEYEIREATAIRGKALRPGELSDGLYGVVSTKKDLLLRCPMTSESAKMYTECETRHVEEIFLMF
jgi:hypothetical protein